MFQEKKMNEFSINEIIELAVQIEKNGYIFYDNALHRKDLSQKSKEILTILRDEEINHEQTFKQLRDKIDISDLMESGDWNMVGSYLSTIAESHIFSQPDAAINLATKANNEKDIIINAIAFEKDTLLFFHSLNDSVQDEKAKEIVKNIIDEEKSHVMKLKKFLDKI